jgi:hypothetical protein
MSRGRHNWLVMLLTNLLLLIMQMSPNRVNLPVASSIIHAVPRGISVNGKENYGDMMSM